MNLDRRRSDLHFVQGPAGGGGGDEGGGDAAEARKHVFSSLLVVVVVDVVSRRLWRQMLSTARVEENIFGPIVAKLSRPEPIKSFPRPPDDTGSLVHKFVCDGVSYKLSMELFMIRLSLFGP